MTSAYDKCLQSFLINMKQMVYLARTNPAGVEDHKISAYLTKSQLKSLAEGGTKGAPMYISHNTQNDKGEKIAPCGMVLSSFLHPKTGELYSWFTLFPGEQNGEFARRLTGEDGVVAPENRLTGLSWGFKILNKNGVPMAHQVNELSLCYDPCHPTCHIVGSIPVEDFKRKPGVSEEDHIKSLAEKINKTKTEMMKLTDTLTKIPERPADAKPMKLEMVETGASAQTQAPPAPIPDTTQMIQTQVREFMNMLGAQAQASQAPQAPQEDLPKINLQNFMAAIPDFVEQPPPENSTPEQVAAWKAREEMNRQMYNDMKRMKMEKRKADFARLEEALGYVIPTVQGTASGFNTDNLAKIYANTDAFDPAYAETLVTLLDAGAATAKRAKKMEMDVNALEKKIKDQAGEFMAKLEEMNKQILALSAPKQPLIQSTQPPAQTLVTPPPPQFQMELTGASKIFAKNLEKAQGPYQDLSQKSIQESAKRLARLFSETN